MCLNMNKNVSMSVWVNLSKSRNECVCVWWQNKCEIGKEPKRECEFEWDYE